MIATAQRHSAIGLLGIALLIVGLTAVTSVRGTVRSLPLDATSAAPNGALGLTTWLQRLDYSVTIRSESVPDFRALPAGSTVMLLESGVDLPGSAVEPAMAFVRKGGTLVVATNGRYNLRILHRLGLTTAPATGARLRVVQPLLMTPPVTRLRGRASVSLRGTAQAVVAVRAGTGPSLALESIRRGRIWVLGAGTLLENRSIAAGDNWRLALNLAGRSGGPVLLDQFIPVAPAAPGNWWTQSTWGVALLFVFALALLYRGLAGRRLGPPVIPLSDRRRAASEYVQSVATLLGRVRGRAEVLQRYQERLERILERHGAMTTEQRETVDFLLRPVQNPSEAELVSRVTAIVRLEDEIERARQ